MIVERLPIAQLRPAPYNPRQTLRPGMPAYERLARSLAEFDLVQPIVWNRTTGHVVGGHQRLEVLKRQGATAVDCVVVELPLAREKALNVALNNERLAGAWDEQKLVDLLDDLSQLPDFDVTLTGFDEADLRDLRLAPQLDVAATGDDAPAEPPIVRVTLEAPPELWESIRPDLDALLAAHRQLRAHVRLPSTNSG